MSKLLKRQSHLLQSGDIIYFVYRKSEPEQNIAYVYQSITCDSQETDELRCSDLAEGFDPDVDPDPVEPVTLPFTPQEVKITAPPEESQPSTSYTIANPTTHTHTATVLSLKRPDGVRETDQQQDRKRQKTEKTDKMEESLTCIICQDLLYDCISLQPCMHTFCAACYSGWMERSSLCPTCRCPVERICKNHILNNLVEAYLLQHPEKCRSDEDLRSMDSRNKISQDLLQPRVERYFSDDDDDGSSDYLLEFSDNDSDVSDLGQPFVTCRQCPGYNKDLSHAPWTCGATPSETAPTSGDSPSTSSDPCTGVQEFTCPPQGSHLICTCCSQPMPDHRAEHVGTNPSPQHCLVCQKPFCHLYWGCQRIGCQGCLLRFSDLKLNEKSLDGVINNNQHETQILQNYLSSRGKTWKEMLKEALESTQQGLYQLSDHRINGNSFLCYCCGVRFFKELAYTYRSNIPATNLPAAVRMRPDCYWGRNCRTQIKAHHALKFNHICEQTRFRD